MSPERSLFLRLQFFFMFPVLLLSACAGQSAVAPESAVAAAPLLMTTGPLAQLQTAAARWLQLPPACCHSIAVPSV